jgi:hypothetical protein
MLPAKHAKGRHNPRIKEFVRNLQRFAMKRVKAVHVDEQQTGGKRRRHV